jgi:hypothetical protein
MGRLRRAILGTLKLQTNGWRRPTQPFHLVDITSAPTGYSRSGRLTSSDDEVEWNVAWELGKALIQDCTGNPRVCENGMEDKGKSEKNGPWHHDPAILERGEDGDTPKLL